jgi:hypothetical protein
VSRHNGDLVALGFAAVAGAERQGKNLKRPSNFFLGSPKGAPWRAAAAGRTMGNDDKSPCGALTRKGRVRSAIIGNAAYRAGTHRRQPDKLMFRKAERRAERAACNL